MPLVLIHALPLDSSMWDGVRKALPELDIITPDAPGFGSSPEGVTFGEPSIATYARAVKALLDELGIERIVLGGLSMGGAVSAEFTAQFPDMIAGLALMDTNIHADEPAGVERRYAVAAKADAGEGYESVSSWPDTMLSSKANGDLRASVDARLRALPDEGLAWQQRAMAARIDRSHALQLVDVPIYLGRGDEDPTCSLEYLMELALLAKNPSIAEFSPASHFAATEQPQQVAAFLKELYSKSYFSS